MKLNIKLFADGADIVDIIKARNNPLIRGFTTNPTLMRKAGVRNYEVFCRSALDAVQELPISFEVFADDLKEMELQARTISSWGRNVYVKIPITNTKSESTAPVIARLTADGIFVNITAVLTLSQVKRIVPHIHPKTPSIVSVFAGRIADTGVDPIPIMRNALSSLSDLTELLWASPREVLNVVQAEACGCHIITASSDILAKLPLLGRDLTAYSLETVRMFHNDAVKSEYKLGE
jgi:transaldolase